MDAISRVRTQGMTRTSAAMDSPAEAPQGGESRISLWKRASFECTHAAVSILLYGLSLKGLYRFGQLFGTVEWLINYKRRRRFHAALTRVCSDKPTGAQRRRETREFFRRNRCDRLFYLILDQIPRAKAETLFSISNEALLDQAVQRGRGVYVALSHHGPHHVAAMLMSLRGHKVAGVRDRREGGIRRYVQARFDRLYPEFGRMRVLFSDSYPRDIYRCFREGFVLGSAMDVSRLRRSNQKAEEVTIFGEKRHFLSGPLRVAVRCGAPVLQAFITPGDAFTYRLEIVESLIDPDTVDDEDAAVARAMQTYAANVERNLRAAPALMTRL
ncbi:MAG: hypothetical protein JSU63_16790 [Phycisphaerales bacterium]|nr:MAG: hypothetical protein JSU63_16790 [Phycisphaerales bacterium]